MNQSAHHAKRQVGRSFLVRIMSEEAISRVLFPASVTLCGITIIHLWVLVAQYLLRPTRKLGRAALKRFPIWSCSGWGLPSFPSRPGNWCALTAPFHPYLARWAHPSLTRRYLFCGTFLRITTTPCYGAPCSAELGLSSRIKRLCQKCGRSFGLL